MTRPWSAIGWNSAGAALWFWYAIQAQNWSASAVGCLQLLLTFCMLFIRVQR